MDIAISSAHFPGAGASGYINEVEESRRVVDAVADFLRHADVGVKTFHDDTSTSQDQNLAVIVGWHNGQARDLDVSVHFNAYEETADPRGTEVWFVTRGELAAVVAGKIAEAGELINRGAKYSDDLYFLNNTECPAILIEVCFVDSQADVEAYQSNFSQICRAVAEGLSGKIIGPERRPPPYLLDANEIAIISRIASNSEIAGYFWEDRGVAPIGFTQGMAVAFAQSYLKLKMGEAVVLELARPRTDSDKDALNIYREEFTALAMNNERGGVTTLRHLYALMLGHGMRESNGRHCEGRDLSADNVESETAEAGLFQTSYNAHSASDPEFSDLMAEYGDADNEDSCYLNVFAEDVSCTEDEWECYGSGEGYRFQMLCKTCPAFAVESCGLTLRNLANHYGPIIRHEVELKAEADDMFRAVQHYIDDEMTTLARV